MSRLMCSHVGDISLYTATIDGKSCVVEIVGCCFQASLPAQDSQAHQLIALWSPSQPWSVDPGSGHVFAWKTRSEKRHALTTCEPR